jgi:hypothetical protein
MAPTVLSVDGDLSPDFLKTLESLEALDDRELWRLAGEVMSLEASRELESLHLKMGDQGLSPEEDAARARLIQEYERSMLIRAQAAKLLKDRGRDISRLLSVAREPYR